MTLNSQSAAPNGHPIRKRMKRREIPGGVRFLTFSCQRRLPLLDTSDTRNVFARSLREARERHGFELIAWVAMPEHVHLIVRPIGSVLLSTTLKSLKLSVAQRILAVLRDSKSAMLSEVALADGSPRVWQKGGGFDRNVRGENELMREIRYVHRNPVTRELVQSPLDWAWSSARWWDGRHRGLPQDSDDVPCDLPPGNPRAWEQWPGFK